MISLGPSLADFDEDHDTAAGWHYIYGLHDPRTGELRYIGKSDRPRERLTNQLNERANTHRCNWLQAPYSGPAHLPIPLPKDAA